MSASESSGCWQQEMCAYFFPDPSDGRRREIAARAFLDHETINKCPTAQVVRSLEGHVALCRDIHDHPEAWTAAFARDIPECRFQHQCMMVAFRAYMRNVLNLKLAIRGRQPDPAACEEGRKMAKMLGSVLDFIAASVPRVFKEYIAAGVKHATFAHCYSKFYAAHGRLVYITLCNAQREFHPREVAGWVRQALEAREWRCPDHETSNCSCIDSGIQRAYIATFGTEPTLQKVSTQTDEELLRIVPNILNAMEQEARPKMADQEFQKLLRAESAPDRRCSGCGKKEFGAAPFKRCGRCRAAIYCSKECQKRQWPAHKLSCRPAPEGKRGNPSAPTPSC